jgi:hypothetical protein
LIALPCRDSLGLVQDGVKLVGWWEPEPLVTVTEHSGNSSDPVIFASVYLRTATAGEEQSDTAAAAAAAAMPKGKHRPLIYHTIMS